MVKVTYKSDKVKSLAMEILRHKRLYYEGKPAISDSDYDQLEQQLQIMAPQHPVLNEVGAQATGVTGKVRHDQAMLSLQKTYSEEELMSWKGDHGIVGTWKVDGNSLSVVYTNGRLSLAKTRGNGRFGEDVTSKARWVSDLVPLLPVTEACEVRGELYCSEHHFAELVEEMLSLGLERPSNPRNIVAGLLGRKSHIDLARYFNFLAFDIISDAPDLQFAHEMDKFDWLSKQGFSIPEPRLLKSQKNVNDYLDHVKSLMDDGSIGLDGAVFSYNHLALH